MQAAVMIVTNAQTPLEYLARPIYHELEPSNVGELASEFDLAELEISRRLPTLDNRESHTLRRAFGCSTSIL
jgi:hypothetical protein